MREKIKNNLAGFILGAIIFSAVGVVAATMASSDVEYTNSKNSSVTNAKEALDDLYEKAETSQEMSSVLEFIEDSIDFDTIQFNTAQTVLASNKGVCIKRNGRLNCFKNDAFSYEKDHLQQVFSDVSCDAVTTGLAPLRHVECNASDFSCTVTQTMGTQCSDATDSSNCKVGFRGGVECT